jgi:hypothetical protein
MVCRRVSPLAPLLAPVAASWAGEVPCARQDRRRLHVPGDRRQARRSSLGTRGWWWEVSHWPRFFDRNQALTALTITELLENGRDSNDPLVLALREGLR